MTNPMNMVQLFVVEFAIEKTKNSPHVRQQVAGWINDGIAT